ncbi:hypothetical protein WJX72_004301 [[Myrmecia] bisecta]|uniref:Uncharacterized protein n=1 Tax=[Myrmecia] bisecta TaxID=41462 RepID=A0AAW1PG53_9CHLO
MATEVKVPAAGFIGSPNNGAPNDPVACPVTTFVTAIRFNCRSNLETFPGSNIYPPSTGGGNSFAMAFELTCSDRSTVKSFSQQTPDQLNGNVLSSPVVGFTVVDVSTVYADSPTAVYDLSAVQPSVGPPNFTGCDQTSTESNENFGFNSNPTSCPPGYRLSGFQSKSGFFLDSLAIYCTIF